MVKAEWILDSYRLVDVDGVIIEEAVSQNGSLERATVQLTCGNYKQEYVFSFMVYPRVLSESEKILKAELNNQSTYGIMKEVTARHIFGTIDFLAEKEYISADNETEVLKLLPKSRDVLFGRERLGDEES